MSKKEIRDLIDVIRIQTRLYGMALRNVETVFRDIEHIKHALYRNLNTLEEMMGDRNT